MDAESNDMPQIGRECMVMMIDCSHWVAVLNDVCLFAAKDVKRNVCFKPACEH